MTTALLSSAARPDDEGHPMVLAGVSDFVTGDLTEWVVGVIAAIGYLGVALLVAVESLFPPIPSEVVLPAAGFAAADGQANLWGMVAAATLGSLVGAWALYLLAAAIGETRLRALTVRHGRWLGVKPHDLDRANAWFDRRSTHAVLICRCIPLIRSLVSVPAGFRRMRALPFTLYTLIGSLAWNLVLIGAGYALGDNWEQVGEHVSRLQYVVVAGLLAAITWWAWTRLLSPTHRARRALEEAEIAAMEPQADRVLDATD
ncbi:DedA family protein [Aquihabitans sp. G128]|uniref:DedA family protein n=1 Tax=Aquihabitans sp. G128 TaxID=2849779 RepID=UPI001C2406FF|nr:DedA family protein [Aquihabitans sp. G128]QXC62423.1 DedA family protein [Aquihabitans sp. G128]